MSMHLCLSYLTMEGMATRRKQRKVHHPVQRNIWSRFERVTQERIDRNRRGRAACEQAIKERRKDP
jgi:hypothetical protein